MRLALMLLLLCGGVATAVKGQSVAEQEESQSNIEEFSSRSGALIEMEHRSLGRFQKCEVDVVHLTDLITETKESGVKFELKVKGQYSTSTKTAFLDRDEVEALLTSIRIIQERVLGRSPDNYVEVKFTSRSGMMAGVYWSDKGKWNGFLKLEKFDSDSYVWFDPAKLTELEALLSTAHGQLQG